MAHEELKKLYEIDKQHSDRPWEFWEIKPYWEGTWGRCHYLGPEWSDIFHYRRKPDAPVWPVNHDAEDARRWKEAVFQSLVTIDDREFRRNFLNILNPKKPTIIQGYTAEQWQTIIDGKFLCEFSDDGGNKDDSVRISVLRELCPERFPFYSGFGSKWEYCRPLRIKGVRQPWFGGECPVKGDVVIKMRNGQVRLTSSIICIGWGHVGLGSDIVEFIEL